MMLSDSARQFRFSLFVCLFVCLRDSNQRNMLETLFFDWVFKALHARALVFILCDVNIYQVRQTF